MPIPQTINKHKLPPLPAHLDGVRKALADGEAKTPLAIAQDSGLTQVQTIGALNALERADEVTITFNKTTPKIVAQKKC